MTKIQFPQINRRFTAGVFLLSFLLVGIINIWENPFLKPNEGQKLQLALLQNPDISSLHEKLGQYYLGLDEQAAKKEYLLAQEYYTNIATTEKTDVLGSQSNPWQTWLNLSAKKHNLETDIKYWEKVSETYPDYLYSSLKLALLNMQKGEDEKAKNYLENILSKDPTDQNAEKLLEKIK